MDAISPTGSDYAARVDRHVGDRIRRRRIMMGYTQEQLADSLEISYQQIQKYETGANRVSAGRLFQIAMCLETQVSFFFEGLTLDSIQPREDEDSLSFAGSSRPIIELVRNFNGISDPDVRTSVTQLVKSLSQAEDQDSPTSERRGSRDTTKNDGRSSSSNGHGSRIQRRCKSLRRQSPKPPVLQTEYNLDVILAGPRG